MVQMAYELVRPSELSLADRAAWRDFTACDPTLGSPYFSLEFAQCCEEARSDTRVLVQRRRGQATGFLPMHVGRVGYARPLGGPLGDVQGVIAAPGEVFAITEALGAVHIPVFNFESALASQAAFRDHQTGCTGSWIIDLSAGYDAWREGRKAIAPKVIRNLDSRRRRMERVEGGFSFVMADQRPDAFETMIAWKRDQYHRTHVFDVFSVNWTRKLLAAILRRESEHFMGLLSTLNINGEIAAVHVGMASDRVCHYWFPAYNADYSRLSPGILMIEEMAQTAAMMGLEAMELGPGDYAFKKDLASYQTGLASGYAVSPSVLGVARKTVRALVNASEHAPLGRASAWPGKAMRKLDRLSSFYAA